LWLHVWVLWALAVAPLIDLVRRHPEFLIANELDRGRLVALLGVVLVLAPLPLVVAAWRSRASAGRLPTVLLAVPSLLVGLTLGQRLAMGALPLAAILAGTLCLLYARRPAVRRYLTWLGLVACVAPLHLLLDPAVRRVGAGHAIDPRASGRPATGGTPVVILLLDELPVTTLLSDSGTLDRRRFPNLARLADRAHWFEDVVAVDPSTPRAVAGILAGAPLAEGELPIAADLPINLFTLLAPTHRISAYEPVTRLCPSSLNGLTNRTRLLGGSSWLLDVAIL
jgi:hypothetical protein